MQRDKELIGRRFAAKFEQYDRLAHTQRRIAGHLATMLIEAMDAAAAPPPRNALEIGAGTGFLTAELLHRFPRAHWHLNDLTPTAERYLSSLTQGIDHDFLWGDAEKLDFPAPLELIATASTAQWFDDLPLLLSKCAAATPPGGYLALATFGSDNFHEIRALTGRGLPYPTIDKIADYEIIARDQWHERMTFDSPRAALRYIGAIGVNALDSAPWTPRKLARLEADYAARFSCVLTYHPILVIAKRKKYT